MYTDQLREAQIDINRIYLDPNNPRFWDKSNVKEYPDKRITDDKVQTTTSEKIKSHGIEELRDSILRNGFLSLDRIVVRPIPDKKDDYVIVEGNRRFAALSMLREEISNGTVNEEGIDEEYLEKLHDDTNYLDILIYQGGKNHDISWLLQGIRHISGIRAWSPAQRARLVAQQVDDNGLGFKAAGQTFGLTAQAVGRLYRAYKGLDQMKNDDEFSSKAQNEYFTLFEESIRNRAMRDWLGWDHESSRFEDEDNLKQFYAWISPDEEHENKRRIHDPRQIKQLGSLISGEHTELLDQIDRHELSIDQAYGMIVDGVSEAGEWRRKLEKVRRLIDSLPQNAMFDDTDEFLQLLEEIQEQVRLRIYATKSVLEQE